MSDNEEDFADTVEGPSSSGGQEQREKDFDMDDAMKKFDDEYDQNEVLRQAQETEELEEKLASIELEDDGHERNLEEALQAKAGGNDFFREKKYDDAVEMYSKAIYFCPVEEEHKEQMSVFYGNRSACYASMEDHELVIADCSSALDLKGNYPKVLMRRCQSFEAMERYDEALKDAKALLELDADYPKARSTLNRLEKLHAEKMEKMKDEAMGKLKDLGNTILGKFGMSLDNFNMQQDPGTGSWSVNMK